MNFQYLLLRVFRHFMPESVARFLLKRRWIIRPGLESRDPSAAVEQYLEGFKRYGKSIEGKRVLVFGYGGRFAVGVELLKKGAAHVILCDHFVLIDKERNLELLPAYDAYLTMQDGEVKPKPEYITLVHGDIREEMIQSQIDKADCVLSTSVFEHLDDVDGITLALAKVTVPQGSQIHFVDLRDHYFKYPFEMLTYSDFVWKNFLNPTSNLNRFRLLNYRKVFETYFNNVDIVITQRNEVEFQAARSRIYSKFLTGDEAIDSVGLIYVMVDSPKR